MKALFNFESSTLEGHAANNEETVQFTSIESHGNTLEELLDNATIGRVDWHGNDREHVEIGELSQLEYFQVGFEICVWHAKAVKHDKGLRAITQVVGA